MKTRSAIIFCIGRELLEGQVLDRNANYLASNLTQRGFRVRSMHVLDDVRGPMVAAFQAALQTGPAYVVTSGGMGPGLYDITRECAAEAAGLRLVLDENAREYLAASYRRLLAKGVVDDAELNEQRLKMATVPEGSTCFENLSGTAPAVTFTTGDTRFFLLPGAPEELRRMFQQFVAPFLEKEGPGDYRDVVHVEFPGGDESLVSRLLSDLGRRHPTVASRARMQGAEDAMTIRITLSVEGADKAALKSELDAAAADLRARLGLEVTWPEEAPGGEQHGD